MIDVALDITRRRHIDDIDAAAHVTIARID